MDCPKGNMLSKPSDMLPELQGRLPIRVELESLSKNDFKLILTETQNSLIKQYVGLLATEKVQLEFDESGIDVEFIKSKIKNKEVFYDHFADKTSSEKWKASYKLRKIDNALLPKYLKNNTEKFKDWFDN